jgi:transposase
MPRLEIFTGAERRRRWREADKLAVLEEASRPGISAASVTQRHDILPQQIYRWRRQFGLARHGGNRGSGASASPPPVSFMPLELVASGHGADRAHPSAAMSAPHRSRGTGHDERLVEVALANGRCLRVCPAIDEAALARLIRVAETA